MPRTLDNKTPFTTFNCIRFFYVYGTGETFLFSESEIESVDTTLWLLLEGDILAPCSSLENLIRSIAAVQEVRDSHLIL